MPDPTVTPIPSQINNTKDLEEQYPHLLPACVVTRSAGAMTLVDTSKITVDMMFIVRILIT